MKKQKILIVEDEKDIRELIHFHLYRNEYEVLEAASGTAGLKIAREENPDLILLDIMLPELDGISVCEELKEDEKTKDIKIVFLSAKGEEEDIVRGLELGADDYVAKPFSPKILMARVAAVLRRSSQDEIRVNSSYGIQIDESKRKVFISDVDIKLSVTEYELLKIFISRPGHVYTRGQIVQAIKGQNHAVTDRSVDTQLVSLRKKMGEKGKLIETVWGVGYRFSENEE